MDKKIKISLLILAFFLNGQINARYEDKFKLVNSKIEKSFHFTN